MNINIRLDGLDGVLKAVSGFEGRQLQNYREGLEDGAQIVETEAKANCEVDTGQLRNSITHRLEGLSAVIGTNNDHAVYNEFGTGAKGDPSVAHTSKKQWTYYNPRTGRFVTTSGMAPRPFLVPALKNNKDNIVNAIKNRMR